MLDGCQPAEVLAAEVRQWLENVSQSVVLVASDSLILFYLPLLFASDSLTLMYLSLLFAGYRSL